MSASRNSDVAMFMSCDVVGSTAYKGECGDGGWIDAFESLFRELPLLFIGHLARTFIDEDDLPESGVWKVAGDEVLLIAKPTGLRDAALLLNAFRHTVLDYDQRMAARWPLRVRGACWAAELGERNRQIEVPEMFGGADKPYLDFLGPDVDTGFRLSSCCSAGEVIVSPNLAEPLSDLADGPDLRFVQRSDRVLKGVCGGQPFPIVLLTDDTALPDPTLGERLRRRREELRDQFGVSMAPPVFRTELASAG